MLIGKADISVSALSFLIYRRIEEAISKKYSILDTSILILTILWFWRDLIGVPKQKTSDL